MRNLDTWVTTGNGFLSRQRRRKFRVQPTSKLHLPPVDDPSSPPPEARPAQPASQSASWPVCVPLLTTSPPPRLFFRGWDRHFVVCRRLSVLTIRFLRTLGKVRTGGTRGSSFSSSLLVFQIFDLLPRFTGSARPRNGRSISRAIYRFVARLCQTASLEPKPIISSTTP